MPTLLIAKNFLRENRWPLLILLAWIIFTAGATAGFGRERVSLDDVVFYVQQQAVYICGFSAFLAASAIYNERKSRRILLVLSKSVGRGEYLLAMLTGTIAMAVVYAAVFAVSCKWLAHRAGLPTDAVWLVAVLVVAGSAIAAAAGMFFSTFLNPYLAIACTVTMFGATRAVASRTSAVVQVGPSAAGVARCVAFPLSCRMDYGLGGCTDCIARSRTVLGVGGDCVFLPGHCCAGGVRRISKVAARTHALRRPLSASRKYSYGVISHTTPLPLAPPAFAVP